MKPRPLARITLVALLGASVVVCALVAFVGLPARATATAQRLAAEQRWAARPFTAYRIVSRMGECRQRGEFQGVRIVRVERQECFDRIRTVESLFTLIERIDAWGLSNPRCAPSGCICRETRAIQVIYDAELGFPRAIRIHKFRAVDWPALLHNPLALASALDCANPPPINMLTVTELTPLPLSPNPAPSGSRPPPQW